MRKGQRKPAHFARVCRACDESFMAADVKACFCPPCKAPRPCRCGCGAMVATPGRFYAQGHNPAWQTTEAHAKQAAAISGDANPSKRSDVRRAISAAVVANHPSRTHGALWRELAQRMRPRPASRLEDTIAKMWPGAERQYVVGGYRFDFAMPGLKLLVEINGCWWHACPDCYPGGAVSSKQLHAVDVDRRKAEAAAADGWRLVVVWEHAILVDKFRALYAATGWPGAEPVRFEETARWAKLARACDAVASAG